MWLYIKDKSYNMDHILQVSSETTKTDKVYLSMVDTRGIEIRIQMKTDDIDRVLRKVNDHEIRCRDDWSKVKI